MTALSNAQSVLDWFRVRHAAWAKMKPGRKPLSFLRGQFLLYYTQGICLATLKQPAFNFDFTKTVDGPIINILQYEYKGQKTLPQINNQAIKNFKSVVSNLKLEQIMNSVFDRFATTSTHVMLVLINQQDIFTKTPDKQKIDKKKLGQFFDHYVLDS